MYHRMSGDQIHPCGATKASTTGRLQGSAAASGKATSSSGSSSKEEAKKDTTWLIFRRKQADAAPEPPEPVTVGVPRVAVAPRERVGISV